MRLIMGLGNPGTRYRDTPHNAGFRVCERLAERHHFPAATRRFHARFARGRIAGEDVALLQPQTWMNRSGDAVAEALRYLPVEPDGVILVFDDLDLPAGWLRIRPRGGDGGHRGVRSVIERIGTREFVRVRVGVGRPTGPQEPSDYLLGRVREEVRERLERAVERAADALEFILDRGVDEAMNLYNGPPPDESAEEGKR